MNPASLPLENNISISLNRLPENINFQNFIISKSLLGYLVKINTSILNYGKLNDFITNNAFDAKDLIVGISVKKELKKIISFGVLFNYLNTKIENYNENIFKSGIGIRTHFFEKRFGLGLSAYKYFNSNSHIQKFPCRLKILCLPVEIQTLK